jgi:hypothetical protein
VATTVIPSAYRQMTGLDHRVGAESTEIPERSILVARLAEAVLRIPPFIQVSCSSPSGFLVRGLLKSISRTGLQVLLPLSLPIGGIVEVTIAHCRAIFGEALYCVKRSGIYQIDIVFTSRHKPEIPVGSVAVIQSLDEPFTLTRGNVVDVGSTRLSIICKTRLVEGAWVRVEANGWILFGLVEAVIATSMLACCVDIRLEAAFPAASTDAGIPGQSPERDEDKWLEGSPRTDECEDCLAGR